MLVQFLNGRAAGRHDEICIGKFFKRTRSRGLKDESWRYQSLYLYCCSLLFRASGRKINTGIGLGLYAMRIIGSHQVCNISRLA